MSFYSKLEAINTVLLESGEHLVNDLSSNQGVDTSVAQFILSQNIKLYVSRGLVSNRFKTIINPDSLGKIYLPTDACFAQVVELLLDPTTNQPIMTSIMQSPTRLYNLTNQTDVFTKALEIDVIVNQDWENIEANMQKAIITATSRDYQRITQGDKDIDRALAEKENKAVMRGRAADIHKKQRNLFTRVFSVWNPRIG